MRIQMPNRPGAGAGGGVQAVAVHDGDAAAAVADQSGALQNAGADRDGGPADAETSVLTDGPIEQVDMRPGGEEIRIR
jgi:hypothetical protein